MPLVTTLRSMERVLPRRVLEKARLGCCAACRTQKTKMAASSMKSVQRSQRAGEVVHADVMGPVSPAGGAALCRYLLVMVDDFSRYTIALPMVSKSQASANLVATLKFVRATTGNPLGMLFIDKGESNTTEVREYLDSVGAQLHLAGTAQHDSNPVAESNIGAHWRMTRALLHFGNI